ncbi:MAG: hypothetical protein R2810_03355 [Flavobacteriales bacterium]|nr:hypothetical protein [Flavobacteriales bacterium]MCB0783065.1 hypothetical protein [Flavobacteriales bacterium]MCB0808759.1 hypothetical protein [Flavobacteriales bacterium]MCB0817493.1 hypothetical protein [Flavobacteriales bacterium]MCB9200879.1 hypothetical protein [Flavobacteriales bacterium]
MKGNSAALVGKVAQWAIAALGIIFVIMILSGSESSGINGGLFISYIAFGLCAVVALVFSLIGVLSGGKKTLMGIGGFAVLCLVAYLMASDSVETGWDITSDTSKWIGMGLGLFYILFGAAAAAILIGEVSRLFK